MDKTAQGKRELEIANCLLDYVSQEFGDEHVSLVAGALMRTSVALVAEYLGTDGGSTAARHAIENVLSEAKLCSNPTRTLQ